MNIRPLYTIPEQIPKHNSLAVGEESESANNSKVSRLLSRGGKIRNREVHQFARIVDLIVEDYVIAPYTAVVEPVTPKQTSTFGLRALLV